MPGTLGTVTIDYKTYGVWLSFTPTVLRNGAINLVIKPEVSQLDFGHTVQIAGIAIPPLIVRRASTTIELRDGQSFVIGGSLDNTSSTAQDQLPWLGDIPVLGALFRSAQYKKNETDLAIIATPRLVRPTRPGDPVKTPLDNTLPANDIDFFLMGKAILSRFPRPTHAWPSGISARSSVTFSICARRGPMSCKSKTEVRAAPSCAGLYEAPFVKNFLDSVQKVLEPGGCGNSAALMTRHTFATGQDR